MNLINNEIIRILKQRTSKTGTPSLLVDSSVPQLEGDYQNTVDLLMDILPLSKEAAYRRLRGEILFSLEETIQICEKLNISLDLLLGITQENYYNYYIRPSFLDNNLESYCEALETTLSVIDYLAEDPQAYIYSSQNSIPHEFLCRYEHIAKVNMYRWLYQIFPNNTPNTFAEFVVPDMVNMKHADAARRVQNIDLYLIIDNYIFISFIDMIQFFLKLGMISPEEVVKMKEELLAVLSDLERATITGEFESGKKLHLFISHTSFDGNYTYLQGKNMRYSSVRMYSLDYLTSENEEICNWQKIWIESLMRYSTMISRCGELQRNKFFAKQREIINTL